MREIFRQFIVFCGVGSINTAIGLAVILILSEGLSVQYMLANALGYGVGLLIGFVLHKNITFKDQSDPTRNKSEFAKFISIFAVAYLIQLAGLFIMVDILGITNWIAQILAIGIYTIINYLGNRLFTFRETQKESS